MEDTASLPRVHILHADICAIFTAGHAELAVESLHALSEGNSMRLICYPTAQTVAFVRLFAFSFLVMSRPDS